MLLGIAPVTWWLEVISSRRGFPPAGRVVPVKGLPEAAKRP
ncbi:hypothetical protein [Amycolatopsis sp.]|nr:hypothetical protein [Amycolatopsis sp.]HVV11803.1 hypothetical protein [Amycolatopsis sp.]